MTPLPPVGLAEATRTWTRIGWLSFGGPAGQTALVTCTALGAASTWL